MQTQCVHILQNAIEFALNPKIPLLKIPFQEKIQSHNHSIDFSTVKDVKKHTKKKWNVDQTFDREKKEKKTE